MAPFEGRVALVTGGASGIGLATVRRLRAAGARVAVADLDPAPVGEADLALVTDVADGGAWPGLVERVERELGGLDVVHLNAGVVGGEGDVTSVSDEAYRRLMRVNVDHVFFGLRSAVPALERRGGGRVVVTASLAGLMGMVVDPVYAATKHAVVGLVRSCAGPLAARGVVISAVCPGIADTPLLGVGREPFVAAGFPLLEADEVAAAVMRALQEGGPGECWYVQPGREPAPYRFAGVPGPRSPGSEGARPPW
ncbi:MAG TPA: SDR family NAD(P)-dependent oxidoreductase [Candidatus Dormibacteraeota bacterium]